jgi:Tfp pilus assembly protein PilP
MRLALISRTLLLLAMPAVLVTCAAAQDHPNVQPSKINDQLNQAPAASQPASAPVPAKAPMPVQQPKAPAKAPSAPQGKAPAKPKAQAKSDAPAKTAAAPVTAPPTTTEKMPSKLPVEKPAEEKASGVRRDPFDPLLNRPVQSSDTPQNLPPGKAGLVVGTLRIDGIVGGAHGMIAIVSNPQQRVYFLREGDKLYDGSVQHITIEAVSFQEVGKDAFGKPLERQVTKRLYPSPGEQQ